MNLLDKVESIMTKEVISVHENDSLSKVEDIFNEHRIHHIPVVHVARLMGIVSKSDFLFFKRGFNYENQDNKIDRLRLKTHLVSDIMTKGVATLSTDDRINVALEIFKENLFHAIPIMQDDRLVGMLSTYDIIKQLAQDQEATMTYNL